MRDFGPSYAVFRRTGFASAVDIDFFWINDCGGHLSGGKESFQLPYRELMSFVADSGLKDGPKECRLLSAAEVTPRFVFMETERLSECISDKRIRRKLVRFLRDNFHWRDYEQVRFYNAVTPYSFIYEALSRRSGAVGGALVLCGQENRETAYFHNYTRNYEEM